MKNKKTGLIIAIILIALIIVAGVVAYVYFATDIFKTNDQAFAKYLFQGNNLNQILKEDVLEQQKNFKQNNSYTSEGELSVNLQSGGETKKVQIATNSKYDNNTKRTYSEATLKNDEESLLKLSYINSEDVYGIKCDDVYQYYVGFRNNNLKQLAQILEMPEEIIANIPDTISFENNNSISEQDIKYFTDTYSQTIIEGIAKEKYSKTDKTTIHINGKTYEANGYALTLNQYDIVQIVSNVLTKAKNDETTLNIIENALPIEKSKLQELLDQAIQMVQTNLTQEISLQITVYASNGQTIRTQININNKLNIMFDIEKNTKTNQKIITTIENLNNTETQDNIQIIVEKGINTDGNTYSVNVIANSEGKIQYQATVNTTLGIVTNNEIHNVSNVYIQDDNNNVTDIYYNKTIKQATEAIEIQELKNSNTVIMNNYAKEQLEPFMNDLVRKYEATIENAFRKINLTTTENVEAIEGSTLAIASANGMNSTGMLVGTMLIVGANSTVDALETENNEQNEIQTHNAKFMPFEGMRSGSNVISLCNAVKLNNTTTIEPEKQVKLQLSKVEENVPIPTESVPITEADNIKAQIKEDKNYQVNFGYTSDGRIVAIGIVEVE